MILNAKDEVPSWDILGNPILFSWPLSISRLESYVMVNFAKNRKIPSHYKGGKALVLPHSFFRSLKKMGGHCNSKYFPKCSRFPSWTPIHAIHSDDNHICPVIWCDNFPRRVHLANRGDSARHSWNQKDLLRRPKTDGIIRQRVDPLNQLVADTTEHLVSMRPIRRDVQQSGKN